MSFTDQYLNYKETEGPEATQSLANFQAAATNDLIYIMESTAYLPFTRTGTITINGDRRIKVGTFIYFEPTNEFFYVSSVVNNVSFWMVIYKDRRLCKWKGVCICQFFPILSRM